MGIKQFKKKWLTGTLTVSMSALLALTPAYPIFASEEAVSQETVSEAAAVSLTFIDQDSAQEIGPDYTANQLKLFAGSTLKEAGLAHESYYDRSTGITYDIADKSQLDQVLGEQTVVYYVKRKEDNESIHVNYVYYKKDRAEDGEAVRHVIRSADGAYAGTEAALGEDGEADLEAIFNDAPESIVQTASEEQREIAFYKLSSDFVLYRNNEIDVIYEPAIHYDVAVHYVNAATGEAIGEKSFTVKGKNVRFKAPEKIEKSTRDEDGKLVTSFYRLKNAEDATIYHSFDAPTSEYTLEYEVSDGEAYEWVIYKYDTESNELIGTDVVEVRQNETASYDAAANTPEGYQLNSGMQATYTKEFGKGERTTYIYYDPSGYTDAREPYDVTVQYIALHLRDGVIEREKLGDAQTVKIEYNDGNAYEIKLPTELTEDGKTYRLMNGQGKSIFHSYFSVTRAGAYEVYYAEEGSDLSQAVITKETVREVTKTVDGKVIRQYIPGVTTTVVENVPGRVITNVVRRQNANGSDTQETTATTKPQTKPSETANESRAESTAESTAESSAENVNSESEPNAADPTKPDEDEVFDGVQTEDITTPQGNLDLDNEGNLNHGENTEASNRIGMILGCIALLVAAAVALFYVLKRRKH